jgi:hypothetical protein
MTRSVSALSIPPNFRRVQPNYEMTWEDLVRRLVKFILGQDTLIETFSQIVLIKVKGYILGRVSHVQIDTGQTIIIESTNTAWSSEEWSLQASAKPIREGDVVCLLKGAPKPIIVRLCGVIIAATPLNDNRTSAEQVLSRPTIHFLRDLLLVWDWEDDLEDSRNQESIER